MFFSRGCAIGVSLLELNVAILISAILLSVLPDIFSQLINVEKKQDVLITKQEQLITASHWLQHDIEHAGYMYCVSAWHRGDMDHSNIINISSDEIQIKRSSLGVAGISEQVDHFSVIVSATIQIKSGDKIYIADCLHQELNRVSQVTQFGDSNIIELSKPLQFHYDQTAKLSLYISHRYYVKATDREDASGQKLLAMYMEDQNGIDHEIVDGVTQLSFRRLNERLINTRLTFGGDEYPLITEMKNV